MAGMLLVPSLVYVLVFWGLAHLLSRALWRLKRPWSRTLPPALLLGACLLVTFLPVYISGGHSSSYRHNLYQLLDLLKDYSIVSWAAPAFSLCLLILLISLLVFQHEPRRLPVFKIAKALRRWMLLGAGMVFLASIAHTHRILFFVKPLAERGMAPAQYRLALALREHPGAEYRSDVSFRTWLEKAANQGYLEAAMELVRHPQSSEDLRHWLEVAAGAGHAEAQYRLFGLLSRSGTGPEAHKVAAEWLRAAAKGGYPPAQHELGRLYLEGRNLFGVEKDLEQARRWLEEAAERGSGKAMEELAWRYAEGEEGFARDSRRAAGFYRKIAEGYRQGRFGFARNLAMAQGSDAQAEKILDLERQARQGEPEALTTLGRQILASRNPGTRGREEGIGLLEKAAEQGNAEIQHELGLIFLLSRHDLPVDLERGRRWWSRASAQNYVPTLEYLAKAFQNSRFGYSVDLLKARDAVERLVDAYGNGAFDTEPDQVKAARWRDELKYFDHLEQLSGGYLSPEQLRAEAQEGDLKAQYQLARQLLIGGNEDSRQEGMAWLERAAEGGLPEAQYRLVTHYENQTHIMREDPRRGVRLLTEAAEARHLKALAALALAYEKGRYGLPRDLHRARELYQRLLHIHMEGDYLGEVDERFIAFQESRLQMLDRLIGD